MEKKNGVDFLAEALEKHGVKILDKNNGSYLKLGSYSYVMVEAKDKFPEELADLIQDWNWMILSEDLFYGGFRVVVEKKGYKIAPIIAILRYSKEFSRRSLMAHIFAFFPPLFFLSLFFYRKSCGKLADFLEEEAEDI